MKTIADEVVRCVCTRCNNTWMQELDHSFAGTVKRWVDNPTDRLGPAADRIGAQRDLTADWDTRGVDLCSPSDPWLYRSHWRLRCWL